VTISLPSYVVHVRRVLWITLAINVCVVLVKLYIGLRSSSLAIMSDAAHSSVDAVNNVMGLLVMSRVRPYADEDHLYGHTKYEVVGALGVVAFMLIAVYEIVSTAIGRLLAGGESITRISPLIILIFGLTILGNLVIIWYERKEGKRLGSQFLLADVKHTQSDLFITLGIIVGLILVALGFPMMDALVSLFVAVLVAIAAYHVLRDAIPVLVDQAVHAPSEIVEVTESIPGVAHAEEVRTRGAGPDCFIEITIAVEDQPLSQAHSIADHVEQSLRDHFGPDCTVTVHIEPRDDGAEEEKAA